MSRGPKAVRLGHSVGLSEHGAAQRSWKWTFLESNFVQSIIGDYISLAYPACHDAMIISSLCFETNMLCVLSVVQNSYCPQLLMFPKQTNETYRVISDLMDIFCAIGTVEQAEQPNYLDEEFLHAGQDEARLKNQVITDSNWACRRGLWEDWKGSLSLLQ
eukprot:1159275-Pelagomonas_calceolata.AAC.9